MRTDRRFASQLRRVEPAFRALVSRIPLQASSPLPPDWLRCEMLERYLLLRHAPLGSVRTVLEVGAGGHAISTVPLAHLVGANGRVLAAERRRWSQFGEVTRASGLAERIRPVACDARRLPVREGALDLAACVHGLRSLPNDETATEVFREMLRAARRVFLAESLPIALTAAQHAHLTMYNLREEVFRATTGRLDDVHYRPLEAIATLVEAAGGVVETSLTFDVDLPHALAYFPRELAESVPNPLDRTSLAARWDEAAVALSRFGEDHPPVGVVVARPR